MAARDEMDLNRLAEEILSVVGRTMQPESLVLWIDHARGEDDTIR